MRIFASVVFLLAPVLGYANELVVSSASVYCMEKVQSRYKYGISLVLQNTSQNNVTLISKTKGTIVVPEQSGKPAEISIAPGESKVNDVLIIPTAGELGLVTLYPGDGARVVHEFSSKREINNTIVEYGSTSIYGGRFNNWVGNVKSKALKVRKLKACKS